MNLWGGRFTKPTDQLVYDFNASISFDQTFYTQDIQGSIAHVKMLAKQGILTSAEGTEIETALNQILEDLNTGKLTIDNSQEDIHSFVESTLIERIGNTGKKLHTGRSRNDQVALDMRLYTRDQVVILNTLIHNLLITINDIMKTHIETIMPGFTHLQKAQPITLAHHLGAYFEMFKRDSSRLEDIYKRMNICPLGSGALAGTTYPLDREYTAELLGFDGPCLNSIDGVSDRDYLIELLSAMATMMMHMSRISEEIIIWNTNEYQFVDLDDTYSTGSSIMPQKKNPDIAELIRGKTGRVYGALTSLLTTMKGIPLAYNKDMQEDKELVFDALTTTKGCLQLLDGMLKSTTFNKDKMRKSATGGFTNATDAADYLVNKGVPFRDAHGIIGQLVLYAIDQNKDLDDLTIAEFKAISEVFPYVEKMMLVNTTSNKVLIDLTKKEIIWSQPLSPKAANQDWNKESRSLAYTLDNNLFVTTADGKTQQVTDEPKGIVCGQSVHRQEFGISKGTFWSPKGNLLAFYRMDESMVTDYPQVNTSTRIATLEPDKYPMAGMTSHKVTVGIYNPATQKTVYLKAGDPTDRYFTNISWSPDEKSVYVIELNRDQNHALLCCYDAETGEPLKNNPLYEEEHTKYVEPQHPIPP